MPPLGPWNDDPPDQPDQPDRPDNELDGELRRLFADDRLAVPVSEDATPAVLAGARRIRRRRAGVTSAAAGIVLIGAVIGGATFASFSPRQPVTPATAPPSVASLETSSAPSGPPSTTSHRVVPRTRKHPTTTTTPPTPTTTTTTPTPTPPVEPPPWTANPLPGFGQ